jgi:signal transduction histidine kinase
MKRQLSLKWLAALSFLSLAVVLVVGYSLLSARFFLRGIDTITADNMAQVVKSYAETIPAMKRESLNSFSGYLIGIRWKQMPDKIRNSFTEPTQDGILLKHDDSEMFSHPDEIIFLMRVTHDNTAYFISNSITKETASPLVGRNSMRNMQTLVTISVMILLIIVAVAWLLFKRITRPASALGQWARTLNTANLQTPPPDFVYPELNELAVLIRASLSSVQDSLEREHRFLRHSSHELRTPISIIRNNIELLYKSKEPDPIFLNPREQHIFERIDRASLTMVHLTETLLWLSRDSAESLPLKNLDLAQLVQGLVAESRYLLKDKEVVLVVETMPSMVTIAEVPARIVLANLIRNAFQHTSRGVIRISQVEACVEIVNDVGATDETEGLGFGLGLQLTRQLTRKLGWTYINEAESGKYRANVRMP